MTIFSWNLPSSSDPATLSGIASINTLTSGSQTIAVGSAGSNFNIQSTGATHTINLPDASGSNRGALTTADWTAFSNKVSSGSLETGLSSAVTSGNSALTSASGYLATRITNSEPKLTVYSGSTLYSDLSLSVEPTNILISRLKFDNSRNELLVTNSGSANAGVLYLSGGSTTTDGASLQLVGNTRTSTSGYCALSCGNIATAYLDLIAPGGQEVRVLSSGNTHSVFYPTGHFQLNPTGSQRIEMYNTGIVFLRRDSGASQLMMRFLNGGSNCGEIVTSTTATSYITTSDYRLKTDVQEIPDALSFLEKADAKKFKWNVDPDGDYTYGFLAHELAEVIPQAVAGEKDAMQEVDGELVPKYQGVDHSKLVPILFQALKELHKKVKDLEKN